MTLLVGWPIKTFLHLLSEISSEWVSSFLTAQIIGYSVPES